MGFCRPALCVALLFAFVVPTSGVAQPVWAVVSGDTLTSVAKEHGIEVTDLIRWNDLSSDQLSIGQRLKVDGPREALAAPSHVVQSGETLTQIAQRLALPIGALCELNPELEPDHIREGQVLRIGRARRKVRYEVRPGETLSMIASRYETTVQELVRTNDGVSADRVRAGRFLTIYTDIPDSLSESVGSPNDGVLRDGVRLPEHRGYVIRDPERAWGTAETIFGIRSAFDAVRRRFPHAPRVEVHDVSRRHGGPLAQHRSHQSGRDADIAYFHRSCRDRACVFRVAKPSQLDAKRQWALFRPWLERGVVESIFVDYSLQRTLYREARRGGARPEQLELWFQYPRGRGHPLGVIRHYRAHKDHFHVRFACHETDESCRTFRPLLMQAQEALAER